MTRRLAWATLREAAATREALAPAIMLPVPAALRLTNLGDTRPDFARHMQEAVYAPRRVRLEAVELVRLPAGSTVHAGSSDILTCGPLLLREHFPPYGEADAPRFLSHMVNPARPRLELPGECLLLSRWGLATWGHWLAELLPLVAMAEAAHPGRFTYILPAGFGEGATQSHAQSLRLHGVSPGRWLALRPGHDHGFAALHAVTPAWTGMALHPAAGDALRRGVPHRPGPARKVALLREPGTGRTLLNEAE